MHEHEHGRDVLFVNRLAGYLADAQPALRGLESVGFRDLRPRPTSECETASVSNDLDVRGTVDAGLLGMIRVRLRIVEGRAVHERDVHSLIGSMSGGERAAFIIADELDDTALAAVEQSRHVFTRTEAILVVKSFADVGIAGWARTVRPRWGS